MASVRLTNEIRESITKAVLQHRFGAELQALVKDRAAFAVSVYNDVFKAADRKRMNDLPEGWLPSIGEVQFRAATSYTSLRLDGHFGDSLGASLPPSKSDTRAWRPIPTKLKHSCLAVYDANHALAVEYAGLDTRLRDVRERHSEASRQISAALSKASSTARLIELWPEMAPFCKPYEDKAPSLPSIPTERLNALLDLPVAEAA